MLVARQRDAARVINRLDDIQVSSAFLLLFVASIRFLVRSFVSHFEFSCRCRTAGALLIKKKSSPTEIRDHQHPLHTGAGTQAPSICAADWRLFSVIAHDRVRNPPPLGTEGTPSPSSLSRRRAWGFAESGATRRLRQRDLSAVQPGLRSTDPSLVLRNCIRLSTSSADRGNVSAYPIGRVCPWVTLVYCGQNA